MAQGLVATPIAPEQRTKRSLIDALLPVLKPGDWSQRDTVACRSLLPGLAGPDIPLVTVGQWQDPLQITLGPERLAAMGLSATQAEQHALAALSARSVHWQMMQSPTPSGAWLELRVHQGPAAAERILDRLEMARLGRDELGATTLAVGIPHGNLLLATTTSMALDTPFNRLVRQLWEEARDAGGTALSPRVFLADDGRLMGMLS